MARLRPLSRQLLLVDDPPVSVERGVVTRIPESGWRVHMDYAVAAAGEGVEGYGAGDRVVLRHPNAGRSLALDGVLYRLVRESDVIGVADP